MVVCICQRFSCIRSHTRANDRGTFALAIEDEPIGVRRDRFRRDDDSETVRRLIPLLEGGVS